MTLTLSLPPETEQKLLKRAAAAGKDVAAFVRDMVEEKLQTPPTFREIFAPLHEAFSRSDMNDEQFGELFEQLRDEVWREKQAKRGEE